MYPLRSKDYRRAERPIPVSKQYRDAAGTTVGRHEVLTAIAVKITQCNRSYFRRTHRSARIKQHWRPQCPVPIPEEHRNTAGRLADDCKVLKPICVEIAHDERAIGTSEASGGLKEAIPIAQKNSNAPGRSRNKLINPITIEFTHSERVSAGGLKIV